MPTTRISHRELRTATWAKLARIYKTKGQTTATRRRIEAEARRCGYDLGGLAAFR